MKSGRARDGFTALTLQYSGPFMIWLQRKFLLADLTDRSWMLEANAGGYLMADYPFTEVTPNPENKPQKKSQFGVALEPEVIKICGFALLMGLIGGLVAEGLLELIYLFTNHFFLRQSIVRDHESCL